MNAKSVLIGMTRDEHDHRGLMHRAWPKHPHSVDMGSKAEHEYQIPADIRHPLLASKPLKLDLLS